MTHTHAHKKPPITCTGHRPKLQHRPCTIMSGLRTRSNRKATTHKTMSTVIALENIEDRTLIANPVTKLVLHIESGQVKPEAKVAAQPPSYHLPRPSSAAHRRCGGLSVLCSGLFHHLLDQSHCHTENQEMKHNECGTRKQSAIRTFLPRIRTRGNVQERMPFTCTMTTAMQRIATVTGSLWHHLPGMLSHAGHNANWYV